MVGFLKSFPNVLLVVQGIEGDRIWFHGLNDVWPVSDFTQVEIHPCLLKFGSTITAAEICDLFRDKQ